MNFLEQTDRPQRTWIAPRPTSARLLVWLAGMTLLIAVVLVWIGAERATPPNVSVFEADLAGLGRAVGLIGAVSIAVPGAVLAYRRQRSLDESNKIKAEADYLSASANFHARRDGIEQDRRTRFVSIAEQLADTAPIVRMAAVSAMEALADEWLGDMYVVETQRRREAQACVNVLCSYLRSPYLPSDKDRSASLTKKVTKTAEAVGQNAIEEHHEYRPNDLEVRLTIVRVIAAHLQPATPPSNRSYGDGRRYGGLWSQMDLDLTGAYLHNPNFSWCLFDGKLTLESARLIGNRVSFEGAHFTGEQTSFQGAHFTAEWVLFGGAHFTGDTEFSEAQFTGTQVRFHKAQFTGKAVRFHEAHFTSEHVWFHEAYFAGERVSFDEAHFTSKRVLFDEAKFHAGSASFSGAQFTAERVSFKGAHFVGSVWFENAQFTADRVQFSETYFVGPALFVGAQFVGERAWFEDARFTSVALFEKARFTGDAEFSGAQFTGKQVRFHGAQFTGEQVRFVGAQFTGEQVWFVEVQFTGDWAWFDEAQFTGRQASFQNTAFAEGAASFTGANLTSIMHLPAGIGIKCDDKTVWPRGIDTAPGGWIPA